MEVKKAPEADIERQRTTGFLLGLVGVLALCYVALEWNTAETDDAVDALELSELVHETELVPMSNVEMLVQLPPERSTEKGEQLRIVDDEEAVQQADEPEGDGAEDNDAGEREAAPADDQVLAPLNADTRQAIQFRVVEELPQYPGGAVELMRWLTKSLRYPPEAQRRKIQGKVVTVFYVEKDGSITGLQVVESLSPECDREALRVLSMMPRWTPGIQNDRPCRTKVSIPIVFKL